MLRDVAKVLVILTALVWLARHPNVGVHVQRGINSVSRYLTHALGLENRDNRAQTLQERVSQPPPKVKQTTSRTSPAPVTHRVVKSSRY